MLKESCCEETEKNSGQQGHSEFFWPCSSQRWQQKSEETAKSDNNRLVFLMKSCVFVVG